jgi:hypothetical protein
MDQATRLNIFNAQTKNVQEIDKAQIQINRAINNAIKHGDYIAVQAFSKTLALVYCAWVEANFSKVIHTPYGFTLNEIQQIKNIYKDNGLEKGWEKCIELGLLKISRRKNSNYVPNMRQELRLLIRLYIVEPSLIRNKVAHGQWKIALNRENTAENIDLTCKLEELDVITISKWFKIYEHLSLIVETLIESPDRAYHRDYWIEITKLREFIAVSETWSMAQKISILKRKPVPKFISKPE